MRHLTEHGVRAPQEEKHKTLNLENPSSGEDRLLSTDPIADFKQSRDPRDFKRIIDLYESSLRAFLRRFVKDANTIDDLIQTTFLKLFRNIERYDADYQTSRGVLFAIARNCAMDELRRVRRCREVSESSLSCVDSDSSGVFCAMLDSTSEPLTQSVRAEDVERVQLSLAELKEPYREILLLSLAGLSQLEIGARTDTSIGTVKSRLFHARRRIAQLLKEY